MKKRKPNPRLLCCASIVALSLSACTQNTGKLKSNETVSDRSLESTDDLFLISKKGARKRLGGKLPDPRSYDNLWDRLFDRFELPDIAHQDVDRELNWFLNHPTYIDRVQTRAEPFLYSIVKLLEKNNLPGELALLPVIESAFQPHAVSPAKAAGIWQFIPSTGRHYGLKQSHSYDGRRDIYASTRAAIKYLKKLKNDFNGDWLLAIAGYNCGEGAVARAIQKNIARGLPTDFWSLDLPQETRSYVPRLLAVAKLFSDADQYGIYLHPIPNQALYKTVKLASQVDLALAANAAEISLDKLMELNPGFKRQQVDLDGSYRLYIPAHKKIVDFKEQLARLIEAQGYYIPAGASNNPVPSAAEKPQLAEVQPTPPVAPPAEVVAEAPQPAPSFEAASQPPAEPVAEKSLADTAPAAPAEAALPLEEPKLALNAPQQAPTEPTLSVSEYEQVVSSSTSLERSSSKAKAKRLDETLADRRWSEPEHGRTASSSSAHEERGQASKTSSRNGHKARDETANERRQADDADNAGKKVRYTVQEGDTLYSIARKNNIDMDELKKMNHLADADDILVGQSIQVWGKDAAHKLPLAKTGAGFKPSQSLKHTVREGETLFSLSRRFNVTVADLRKWNAIKDGKQFRAGMNITVYADKD